MKKILLIITFLLVGYSTWAQPQGKDRIEAAKIGLITQQLGLTSEQSKQFWPVYNKYSEEMQILRSQQREIRKGFQTKTDEQLRKDLDKVMEIKEKEVATEKKYIQEFLKVINIRQVAMLYKAETMFKAMLLKRLTKRDNKKEEDILDEIDD
ncbi:MAG: hypothetical protein EAZ08_07365 [Cytophagales bacterium]|nr:MAG: hypothetical protein EAZ08_07365 [Cytophagales bacterium]